jgi:hypothetical protein
MPQRKLQLQPKPTRHVFPPWWGGQVVVKDNGTVIQGPTCSEQLCCIAQGHGDSTVDGEQYEGRIQPPPSPRFCLSTLSRLRTCRCIETCSTGPPSSTCRVRPFPGTPTIVPELRANGSNSPSTWTWPRPFKLEPGLWLDGMREWVLQRPTDCWEPQRLQREPYDLQPRTALVDLKTRK